MDCAELTSKSKTHQNLREIVEIGVEIEKSCQIYGEADAA